MRGRDASAVEALEALVDPGGELRDPLEVTALGAAEHTVQQLLERLRAQPTQTARVERAEAGAIGEPVILGRVVAATRGTDVSNGEGREARLRRGASPNVTRRLSPQFGGVGAMRSVRPGTSAVEPLRLLFLGLSLGSRASPATRLTIKERTLGSDHIELVRLAPKLYGRGNA